MKRTAALRVTGEICFYFSILTLFSAFQPWQLPMAGFTLACLVIGLIAVGVQSAPLRVLLGLLPGACFLFAPLSPLLIFPCLAWLYYVLYLGLGRFGIALYDYRLAFRWMLIISAFVLVLQAINSMLFGGAALSYVSLAYMAAFVLLGVLAMRSMQMGAGMDRRWHAANALTVAGTLFAAVAISLLLYELYRYSVPAVVFLLSPLRRLLQWLFSLFRFSAPVKAPQITPPLETEPPALLEELPFQSESELHAVDRFETSALERLTDQMVNVGAFLILALLAFVVLWLIIKLIRRGKALAEESVEYEETEDFTPDRRRRRTKPEAVHGPAQAVRKIYRDYLDYLRENGLSRSVSDTSAEILAESERISAVSAPAEETLRRIYLKARYSADTVTEADVADARRCFDEIRSRDKG